MKLIKTILFLTLTAVCLNFNHSYAQVYSDNSTNSTTSTDQFQEYYNIGNQFFDNGTYNIAIFYYDKALSIDSNDMNALYNKALALDRLGNSTEAIESYQKILAINPNDTDTLNNIGLALDNTGKTNEAITYYDKAIAIAPNDTYALYNKGLALEELGYKDNATEYFKKVLAIDPTDTDALNKLNLTFNNANSTTIEGTQKIDKTLLVAVGVFGSLAGGIFVISVLGKRSDRKGKAKAIVENSPNEIDQSQDKKYDLESKDDDWKGI